MRTPATIAALILLLAPQRVSAQTSNSAAEQALFALANRERRAQGLRAFKWDKKLASAARQHALRMARQKSLSHQFPGEPDLAARAGRAGVSFETVAENVAQGASAANIHSQWMNSAPHRANLLDADLDTVGIAVVLQGRQLFAVADFAQALADSSQNGLGSQPAAQPATQQFPSRAGVVPPCVAGASRVCRAYAPLFSVLAPFDRTISP